MDQQKTDILDKIAREFGAIAKKVNESSKKRKAHAEETLKNITLSVEIGNDLKTDIESVSRMDNNLRDQNNVVLNTCKIIISNITKQREIINELISKNAIEKHLEESLKGKIDYLTESINEAITNVEDIIEKNNELLLMDNRLFMRKKMQLDALHLLKNDGQKSLEDAERAISGSRSNLERGSQMAERFQSAGELIEKKDTRQLKNLIEEAKTGWQIAVKVNNSSKSQYEFAEKVNKFTAQLHHDSNVIKEIVNFKHDYFENNIQTITVLTVILSLKLKKYINIEELVDSIADNDEWRDLKINLSTYVKIACKDIKELAVLNYDMADSTLLNNEIETKTVELTTKEIIYYDNIKQEVSKMTEATSYPVEGSGENITNGKLLENHLKEIIDSL